MQKDMKLLPYKIDDKDGKPMISVDGQQYSPEQVQLLKLLENMQETGAITYLKVYDSLCYYPNLVLDSPDSM